MSWNHPRTFFYHPQVVRGCESWCFVQGGASNRERHSREKGAFDNPGTYDTMTQAGEFLVLDDKGFCRRHTGLESKTQANRILSALKEILF